VCSSDLTYFFQGAYQTGTPEDEHASGLENKNDYFNCRVS